MLHPAATLAGLNFYFCFSCIDILLFLSLIPLQVSGNCVSDALDQLKTSPLFFNSSQGGAGELRLQRRPEPPSAGLLQGWSGGAGWGRWDQQIRSAQPEAPRPTCHRCPAQTEGVHLRLWVRLTQMGSSSDYYLLLSLLEMCSTLEHMFCMNLLPPFAFSWASHLLVAGDLHPHFSNFYTYFVHSEQQKFFFPFCSFLPLWGKCS